MGKDEPERQRAESQWIVAARPLCHLQYPVAYLSCLQRILPAAFCPPLDKAAASTLLPRPFRCGGLANDTCPWGPRPLLRVGKRTAGACIASSPDFDLEAFSHNPAHGSFAPLAVQPSAMTNCVNQRFLSYWVELLFRQSPTDSRRVRDWDPRAQPSEPILFPNLRIQFADFPCLHCSIDQRGRWEHTRHHATCGALPAAGPYLRLSRFQGSTNPCARSAPTAAPPGLAPKVLQRLPRPPTPRGLPLAPTGVGRALKRHPFSRLVDSADERFARQYRCGPPPEFPLASPRSGIVHHLSGPDRVRARRGSHPLRRPLPGDLGPRVVPPDLGSRSERLSAKGSWSPNARRAVAAATKRVELQPPLAATSVDVDSHLGQPRARGLREASIRPATTARPAVGARCEGGDAMRDAQADVPSA
ncbi:hypothetical protein CQW23_32883 [Capsicum baccatum]|uniref:Protein TAR1 n=1 Tax=Capsicum baccatum TaxID=33114 RepID=A0A2G2V3E8_CAPBA|nr:hypothetical protein CQW23_32883 [Capsicum baccatum]